jgi:hypothetical protein
MCALCGAFGVTEHWTDGTAANADSATPFAERRARAEAANQLLGFYGLKLSEWGGRYTLTGRTGKMAVVEHFGALWPDAERLAGRVCDPLDPAIVEAVERIGAG